MGASGPFDTLVIGAGLSGLAAGIRLATMGQRVVVLERHALPGGLNSFYKLGGHRFDTGLHALTNYAPRAARGLPLTRILRKLRIPWEALRLEEQRGSRIVFPDHELSFANDFELLREEVHQGFPSEREGFDRLAALVAETRHDDPQPPVGARQVLAQHLRDPLLVDMLLHPLLWYGSPTPRDMDWSTCVVLWKSIYEEGLSRPAGGIRSLLDLLRARLTEEGGELRMRTGVERIVHDEEGVRGVVLEDGSQLEARRILSSAGWVETMALCGGELARAHGPAEAGRMAFVETISVLDTPPEALGWGTTIAFFNLAPTTVYEEPAEAFDARSGVLCCPTNYPGESADDEPHWRVTLLARSEAWLSSDPEPYQALKESAWNAALEATATFAAHVRQHTVFRDVFTPRTVVRFTGKLNGAVYGAPVKRRGGETPLPGLALIGTDQGNYGIVGALHSGILMAGVHTLQPHP